MVIDCSSCTDGTASDGNPCAVCGGDGEIDLTDAAFQKIGIGQKRALHGQVWSAILTKLDALQDDMDIIKPQIDALYEDLNP